MTLTTTQPVEIAASSASNEDRLAAAAEHMCAAESFLHTARQAGVEDWVSVAYQHLHAAMAEHVACLYECSAHEPVVAAADMILRDEAADHGAEVDGLQVIFPRVPTRIVTAVFQANLAVARTTAEAIQATRARLCDALAA